jgi:hypothetical protein
MMVPLINPCHKNKAKKVTRRTKSQIATRKARAKKGLAFKSADLALDRKILKEIRSLKSAIKKKNPKREIGFHFKDSASLMRYLDQSVTKGAAKSGPHSSTKQKESAMARRKRRNPTKKGKAGYRKLMAKGAKTAGQYRTKKPRRHGKKSHVTARAKRRAVAYMGLKAHRPLIYKIKGKYYRARNRKGRKSSRFFGTGAAVRINGRRRRHSVRFNPFTIKGAMNKAMWMKVGGLAAGFIGGAVAMPFVAQIAQKTIDKAGEYKKYYGVAHVLLGGLLLWKGKKAMLKDVGTTLMASGVYDLIAEQMPQYLTPLSKSGNAMTAAVGLGASYQPRRLSASYQTARAPIGAAYMQPVAVGSSYEKSIAVAGLSSDYGDDPYETCFE